MAWYSFLFGNRPQLSTEETQRQMVPSAGTLKLEAQPNESRSDSASDMNGAMMISPLSMSGVPGFDKAASFQINLTKKPLDWQRARWLYRFSGIARRIANLIVDDSTRQGWHVMGDDNPDLMKQADQQLHIPAKINLGKKLARRSGRACLMLVVEEKGITTTADLAKPMVLENVVALRNIIVLDRSECAPTTYAAGDALDAASEDFREPQYWSVYPRVAGGSIGFPAVHRSRIIYLQGDFVGLQERIENGYADSSVYDACYDSLKNFLGIGASSATLVGEHNVHYARLQNNAARQAGQQRESWIQRMRMMNVMKGLNRMVTINAGDDYGIVSGSLSGIDAISTKSQEAVSADSNYPVTVLFGQAPSGLTTDNEAARTHMENWATAYQESDLREPLEYVYNVVLHSAEGPTNGDVPEDWRLVFNPIRIMDEGQKAELQNKMAQTDAINIGNGVYTAADVAKSRFAGEYSVDMLPVEPVELGLSTQELLRGLDEQLPELAGVNNAG